jgi:hypothetical protein
LPEGFKYAEKVVKLYALRMKAFRDAKSHPLRTQPLHRAYQVERLQILLLIATLALMVAWLMGKATELAHRPASSLSSQNRPKPRRTIDDLRWPQIH